MPHVVVEYSDNIQKVDTQKLLTRINQCLIETGEFQPLDIKSRVLTNSAYLVGLETGSHAYVYLKLSLLEGRSDAFKAAISEKLAQVIAEQDYGQMDGLQVQLCCEVCEINRASYRKVSIDS
ncbi:5-carboxymethyl-2-hydroxymuconate Delta-isomerase [Acinetobacter sp. WZC-1]|uniref:5-carboxymethyl-2-hydroxymuconate Delta-isomerase n=1 Tax=Acinetobacter sp. WZC-1 TaxID=3459034 RepID=UPI00403D734F